MNNITLGVVAAIASLAGGAQAMAQNQQPQHMARPSEMREGNRDFADRFSTASLFANPESASRAYEHAAVTARCMVRTGGNRAASLLGGAGTDDPDYSDMSRALRGRYSGCVRDVAGLVPVILNGALAEQLLLRENPTLDDRAANVDVTKAEAYHGNLNGAGVTLSNFSRCLAVYSPGLAFKVLKSDPGTSGEEDAVDALYGATPECGLTARPADIAPTAQRGPIAEGLYYWLHP